MVLRTYMLCMVCCVVSVFGLLSVGHGAPGEAFGPCEPGFVQDRRHSLPIMLAATPGPGTEQAGQATLEWLGHSSFLLTSPEGLRILTDPNGYHAMTVPPDVVTVSNFHGTHTAVHAVPGTPRVLLGLEPDGSWNPIAVRLRDVALFNLPSYASRTELEESPVHNSIFVFHLGGLCVVHLGNLRHQLTLKQLQRLGKPDVLLLPADGQWTLSFGDALAVIRQLQPLLVVPMHLDFSGHAEVFARHVADRYPTRYIEGHTLPLNRQALPVTTEIVVFRGADRFTVPMPSAPPLRQ